MSVIWNPTRKKEQSEANAQPDDGDQDDQEQAEAPKASLENYDDERAGRTLEMLEIQKS